MLFSKKTKDDCFLLCDIGSGSVALALVKDSDKRETILLVRNRLLSNGELNRKGKEEQNSLYALKALSKEFLTRLSEIQKNRSIHLKRAHIVFSSPWYVSKTIAREIKKDEFFMLDSHFLTEVVDAEEKSFEQHVADEHNIRYSGKGIHMIEREIMRVALNGYNTPNPYLKKAKHIDFSLYMGIVSYDFLLNIDSILRSTFHLSFVTAHTFPLLAFKAISRIYPHEKNFIIIDFGAETTDISFVEEGVIITSESFPYGRSHIIQNISKELSVPIDVAESFIKMMKEGTLEEATSKKISDSISRSLTFWIERWNDVCLRSDCSDIQSKKIHITVKNDISPFVSEIITKELHGNAFTISSESTKDHVAFKGTSYDPSIAVSAIAV